MITLFHGDNIVKSREAYYQIKSHNFDKEIRELDGSNIKITDLIQSISSQSLFGSKIVVLIENLFKQSKTKKIFKELCLILKSNPDCDIYLWESGKVSPSTLKDLENIKEYLFQIPVVIFKFLDSLYPRSGKSTIEWYRKAKEADQPELIYNLLLKRLRLLLLIKVGMKLEGLQDWQLGRLTSQSKLFTIDQLVSMLNHFYKIDIQLKTGFNSLPLSQKIELFLLDFCVLT